MIQTVLNFLVLLYCIDPTTSSQIPCGQRSNDSKVWPWHVAVSRINPDPEYPSCGGTILNDLYVITAGHCLYDLAGIEIKAHLLVVIIDRPKTRQSLYVKKVFFPYTFDVNKFENDVVLVKLDKRVVFSDEVGPICITEDADVFPSGKVTIPVITRQSKAVLTVEWDVTNYDLCHETNRYIFNSSYNNTICMGYIRRTDKFQLYRGSGLMINRNSSWQLVGILMYTVGPNEDTPTYGGGIVLAPYAKVIIKQVNRHLIPSISEKKCAYYNQISKAKPEDYFYPYIGLLQKHDDSIVSECIGTLISERFILTAATCTNSLNTIRLWLDFTNISFQRNFRIHLHSKDVYRQGIALVELEQNASFMEYLIHCLWTNDEASREFVTDIRHGFSFLSTKVRAIYEPETAVSYRFEECQSFKVSLSLKPGAALVTKSAGEIAKRVVGVFTQQIEDCRSGMALNVVSYLDWIEETVWGNDTIPNV